MASAGLLQGHVIELHFGSPVEQAQVSLISLFGRHTSVKIETAEDGGFSVPGIATGRYRIDVSRTGYADTSLFVAAQEGKTTVLIRLAKAGVISGRVMTNAGVPASGLSVFALARTPGTRALKRLGNAVGTVDDRGFYRLYGLPPGEYTVAVSASGEGAGVTILGGGQTPSTLSIMSGDEYRNINLTLEPRPVYSIEGRLDPFEPNHNINVSLVLHDIPSISVAHTEVDSSGNFRFGRVQQGSYDVLASGPYSYKVNGGFGGPLGRDPVFGRSAVDIDDRSENGILLPMRRGRAVAFRLSSVKPTADNAACGDHATLRLSAIDAWGGSTGREVEVNAKGATPVAGLAPAHYAVAVRGLPRSCYYPGDSVLDLTGAVPEVVTVRLAQAASLDGRLVNAGHADPKEFIVLLWRERPLEGEPAFVIAIPDPEGRFFVKDLRPGKFRIQATLLRKWSELQWEANTRSILEFELAPGVTNMEYPLPVARAHSVVPGYPGKEDAAKADR
ncbi:MAG TPA: carboxypeptidase-like regulatory domain-containing protein [Bryobacteraceae bacterium]|nr:carboxypeptidase-like regulatory domain-containing protein [Bryobacteraceae bacterium]